MQQFEEMGNDDAVHTALDARRQETCSANWNLASEDETPAGREILEFVEDNIYPVIDDCSAGSPAARCSTASARRAGLRSGAIADRRGALAREGQASDARGSAGSICRSSRTFASRGHDLQISETGDLQTLIQYVYNGVTFRDRDPGREGPALDVQPAGRRLLGCAADSGTAYKAWTFKTQLERLNVLSFDRFGVGVPVVEEPEGGFTPLERSRASRST
jgi:hypothetical protein